MREIKFRAWDILNKQMLYNIGLSISGIQVYDKINNFPNTIILDKEKDCFKLMQFTGMEDKNEKDLYEGDIIDVLGVHMYIEYNENAFCTFRMDGRFNSLQLFTSSSIIIGNIYEDNVTYCEQKVEDLK